MRDQIRCQIRCTVCNQWADSPVQCDTAKEFFTSKLVGKTAHCAWCGETTQCSIERMRFDEQRDGKEGTYVEGKDSTESKGKEHGKGRGGRTAKSEDAC